jgi:hypothetical protein
MQQAARGEAMASEAAQVVRRRLAGWISNRARQHSPSRPDPENKIFQREPDD